VAWVVVRQRPAAIARQLDREQLVRLAVLGLVLIAVTQGAQYVALAHQPAATTSLVLAMTPAFVAVIAAITLAELPSWRQVLGVLLVAGGAALFFAGELGFTALGMLAAVVCVAANVAGAVLGRDVNRAARLSPVLVTTVSMSVGAVVLLAAGLSLEGLPDLGLRARAWLLIGWLAIVNTAFAFTLWNRSLQRLSAVASASLNNTMLVQVALLAWLLLGEDPGAAGLAGIIIVSVGVLLTLRRDRAVR
jgi:drug/metabolite transporter (DMT)-like permease